ncbi:Polyketide cyclase / dehydrase and lipid transport [Streptomyces zhaozhouensis]|uniref:Polyketide cyclase / dehydrase and lipid transport n=1 Tax=Streptomyces zhaozhouensis TaxID=1300267 RepID=A0A286DWD0_9ACTN|nr:SRPBCC family protein [Streptomyces zhaozhouensis]SOD62933.1 Polyketide cyclase / dehydrase and lipid transport [Streptomyces zhaozhouensis]
MAVRHHLVFRPPPAVWRVLEDPRRYAEWVVGTRESAPAVDTWPEVGSALAYTVRLGRHDLHGRTWVRRYEPPHVLELEADSGPLGTARIALEIRRWGRNTLVIMEEHPLRGLGGRMHNVVLDAAQQLRHRGMLARLARLVEELTPEEPPEAERRPPPRPRA